MTKHSLTGNKECWGVDYDTNQEISHLCLFIILRISSVHIVCFDQIYLYIHSPSTLSLSLPSLSPHISCGFTLNPVSTGCFLDVHGNRTISWSMDSLSGGIPAGYTDFPSPSSQQLSINS